MDGLTWTVFALAAFAGGFVSGFSGFAMGLVVSGAWLHIITPLQTAALIAGYGLLTQGYGIVKLRRALNWQAIWPLALGSAVGIPVGVYLLTYIDLLLLRAGVGAVLMMYSAYSLLRPAIGPFAIGPGGDLAIGFANGILGGLTGLGGVISTISCQWRGGRKTYSGASSSPFCSQLSSSSTSRWDSPARSRRRHSVSMPSAFRFCLRVSGEVSISTDRSMTRPSASRSLCCC